MDNRERRVILFLLMLVRKSKNSNRPENEVFQGILYDLARFPSAAESMRIELVVRLLASLSSPEVNKVRVTVALRSALKDYRWAYNPTYTKDGLRAILVPASGEAGNRREHGAIRDLMALADYGDIWRLFECEICGDLGFAAGKKQRFCGSICKQDEYDNNPARKAKKKEHMRLAREDTKRRAKNPKSGIGLGLAPDRKSRSVPLKS